MSTKNSMVVIQKMRNIGTMERPSAFCFFNETMYFTL